MYVCMYVCMICMYVCMYVCVCVCVCAYMSGNAKLKVCCLSVWNVSAIHLS